MRHFRKITTLDLLMGAVLALGLLAVVFSVLLLRASVARDRRSRELAAREAAPPSLAATIVPRRVRDVAPYKPLGDFRLVDPTRLVASATRAPGASAAN